MWNLSLIFDSLVAFGALWFQNRMIYRKTKRCFAIVLALNNNSGVLPTIPNFSRECHKMHNLAFKALWYVPTNRQKSVRYRKLWSPNPAAVSEFWQEARKWQFLRMRSTNLAKSSSKRLARRRAAFKLKLGIAISNPEFSNPVISRLFRNYKNVFI